VEKIRIKKTKDVKTAAFKNEKRKHPLDSETKQKKEEIRKGG